MPRRKTTGGNPVTKTTSIGLATKEAELKEEEMEPEAVKDEQVELTSTVRKLEEKGGTVTWIQTCPYCSGETRDLVGHIRGNHKGQNWKGIRTQCPLCEKMVVDVKNHIRMVHDKIKNFACEICKSTFVSRSRVQLHIDSVHKGIRKKCPHCPMRLKVTCLKGHIAKVHEGRNVQRVLCSAGCGKYYNCKADMERHVLRVHLKYRVKCEFCDDRIDPDLLTRHVRTKHQGIFKLYCNICQAGFNTESSLKAHMGKVHTGVFVLCSIPQVKEEGVCKKMLLSDEGILAHTKKHLDQDYKVLCKDCGTEVYSCYLEHHQKKFHSKTKWKCDLIGCDAEFSKRAEMMSHFCDDHGNLVEYMDWCNLCNILTFNLSNHTQYFHNENVWKSSEFGLMYKLKMGTMCPEEDCKFFAVNQVALNRHIKLVHLKSLFARCELCKKTVRNLDKHNSLHHGAGHKCPTCLKEFPTRKSLKVHGKVHTRGKKTCPHCQTEVVQLKQHIDSVHLDIKKFKCDVEGCTTTFCSGLAKRKHMAHVHEGVKHCCELCSKEVVDLRSHIKLVHEKVRAFRCPECGKSFQAGAHLRNHITRVHLKIKDKCEECGKMVQDLYIHSMLVHKKRKNFPCDQCNARFFTSTSLRSHIQCIHLREREKCKNCGRKFSKNFIRNHTKTCLMENDDSYFGCKECGKAFGLQQTLDRHRKSKHGIEIKNEELKEEKVDVDVSGGEKILFDDFLEIASDTTKLDGGVGPQSSFFITT